MDAPIKFSVIIVNYNSGAYLAEALRSLQAQTFKDFEVLLIDNASKDTSLSDLDPDLLRNVTVLHQDENLGFAKANNIGASAAKGEWLALLNPDAQAAPEWLETVLDGIKRYPDTLAFASTQIATEDSTILDGVGDEYLVYGIPWRSGFQAPIETRPNEKECFSPCGASAVYYRQTFLEHGGFDERFFCYCEDVDLGFRMQLAGQRCIFLPNAVVYHAGSAVSGRESYFTTFHGNRNRTWTFVKNMPLPLLVLLMPAHLAIIGYIYVRNRDRFQHSGMKDGLREGFKTALSIRRDKSQRGRAYPKNLWGFIRSMAWNPFVVRDRRSVKRSIR